MFNSSSVTTGLQGVGVVSESHTATVRHFDPDPRVVLLGRMLMLPLLLLAAAMTWSSLILLGVLTTEVRWLQPDPRKSYVWDAAFALAMAVLLLAQAWLIGVGMAPRQSDALACDRDGIWPNAKGKTDGLVRWSEIASLRRRWGHRFLVLDRDGRFLLAFHPYLKGVGDLLLAIHGRASLVGTQVLGKSRKALYYLWWVFAVVGLGFLLLTQYQSFQTVAESAFVLQDDRAWLARVLANPRLSGRPEVVRRAENWVSESWADVGVSVFVALVIALASVLVARILGKAPIRVTVDTEGVECLWPSGLRRYRFEEIAAVQFGTSLWIKLQLQLRLLDGRQVDILVMDFRSPGALPPSVALCHEIRRGLVEFRAHRAVAGRT
jgi:hypothetical protein